MSEINSSLNGAKPIRRSLVLDHLYDPQGGDYEQDYYHQYFPEDEDARGLADGGFAAPEVSLGETRAWLGDLCKQEQARAVSSADAASESSELGNATSMFRAEEVGMDTAVLERIKRGEGPRDKVFEDLLAPLRIRDVPKGEESYDDMKQVLLAWNQRIAGNGEDDGISRQKFIAALEERLKVVVGQDGILEPSRRRLLKTIHAYRPETVHFENQNPFDMLVIMWAHICIANPDIRGNDDDWMHLTFKAMTAESELAHRFNLAEGKRFFSEQKAMAMRRGDRAGIKRCTHRWEAYNARLADESHQRTLSQVHHGRRALREISLDELLGLSILQTAQKWAGKETRQRESSPPWTELWDACAEADAKLAQCRQHCLVDLQAVSEVAANQVEEMTTIQNMVLTRTLKFTGEDLVGRDKAAKERIIEARLNDAVTPILMGQTLSGVLESQRVATQILGYVGGMEKGLGELLDAATRRYREYDNLTHLISWDQSLRGRRCGEDVDAEELRLMRSGV
ncbi:hypothetical protein EJ02DRAFT_91708 [Clathrospora elynae]|uniref:Uncharacterized protein n=1 Tax=Clathrospora elynae TaxID=706981 RepID=A0A6A5T4I6_9PLEO|nr:hypothetical protein EJ02DRAFT_91708 [Clathrospora elynae]